MDETKEGTSPEAPVEGKLTNLAAAVAREQRGRARREGLDKRVKRSRIHPSLLLALLLVLGLLLWLDLNSSEGIQPIPVELSLQETIYLTALALNAEWEETGAYPPDLETLGMDEEGIQYTLGSQGYSLVAEREGVRIEYRSGEELEPFRAAFERLLPPFEDGR